MEFSPQRDFNLQHVVLVSGNGCFSSAGGVGPGCIVCINEAQLIWSGDYTICVGRITSTHLISLYTILLMFKNLLIFSVLVMEFVISLFSQSSRLMLCFSVMAQKGLVFNILLVYTIFLVVLNSVY